MVGRHFETRVFVRRVRRLPQAHREWGGNLEKSTRVDGESKLEEGLKRPKNPRDGGMVLQEKVSGYPKGTSQYGEGLWRWRSLERLPTVRCLMVRPLKVTSVQTTRNNELIPTRPTGCSRIP